MYYNLSPTAFFPFFGFFLYSLIVTVLMFKFKFEATHDTLTKLLNNKTFEKQLVEKMRFVKKYKNCKLLYFMIDLDDFKKINDMFGHRCGDYVLRQVAEIIHKLVGNIRGGFGIVGRYGGEEFCIAVLIPITASSSIRGIAMGMDIHKYMAKTITKVHCTASIGISEFTYQDDINVEKLVVESDIAMYNAKGNGKNQTKFFDISLLKRGSYNQDTKRRSPNELLQNN